MKAQVDSKGSAASGIDRRRHARYRFSAPVNVRCADGTVKPAMSLEISESGMSLLLADTLPVGEIVQLEPVAGTKVSAEIRHLIGKVHGVQFKDLTAAQVKQIQANCKILPIYRTNTLDI